VRPAVCFTLAAAQLYSQAMVDTFAGRKIRSGVPAQEVALAYPQLGGVGFNPAGNLMLCDQPAILIRRIRSDGTIGGIETSKLVTVAVR
jgi:hypothetical protein